ncbi:MAG: calcium/sodium antiporter [Sedimentisphaerales bacterium]|nr:calcium/sodium antiporter [Sedimentisphaerales bacterium]
MIVAFEIIFGFCFLIAGAELLVRGSTRFALAVGISPLVVGLTVVAFGTSAPEFAVSMKASLAGQADIALGNAVGSNIFNVLLILGVSALIVPLSISRQLVRLDVPVMIGVSVLMWILAANGNLSRIEGLFFVAAIVSYTTVLILLGRRSADAAGQQTVPAKRSEPGHSYKRLTIALLILGGLGLLVLGARLLVDGSVALARLLKVGELIIGLTIVAAGTSLPEVATSIVASIRGERDIAVGNVVGSNIFNILCVLGASAAASKTGITVTTQALKFDIPVMTAAAVACLPVFFTGSRISRGEGVLFLGYYAAYIVYLIRLAKTPADVENFGRILWWYVIPLTAIVLIISVVFSLRAGRQKTTIT